MFQQHDLPDDYEIISVQEGENQSDVIYSISEGENVENLNHGINSLTHKIFVLIEDSRTWWIGPNAGYKAKVQVSQKQAKCHHLWRINEDLPADLERCIYCKKTSQRRHRHHCPLCEVTSCEMCSMYYFDKRTPVALDEQPRYEPKNFMLQQTDYINHCEEEIKKLRGALEAEKEKDKESREIQNQAGALLVAQENFQLKHEPEEMRRKYQQLEQEGLEMDRLRMERADLQKEIQILRRKGKTQEEETYVLMEEGSQRILSAETSDPSGTKNMLFNLKVQIEIPGAPIFRVNAILDTGATTCCIDDKAAPEMTLEKSPYPVHFSGITSKATADMKLRGGNMTIGDNSFRIPYTYAFPMKLGDDIQMIIGCNFIRAMQGGVRIKGNVVTFYKNLTTVNTLPYTPAAVAIEKLDRDEEDYI